MGSRSTREAVRWWEVMGTLAWGVICIVQSRRHLDGHTRSVELATIGRRVAETEYDLLHLLGVTLPAGREAEEAPGTGARATLHDRPTAAELIEAVRAYVEDEVLPATEGAVHFHGQVAVNALKIVERELASGDGPRAAHERRLARAGLCRRRRARRGHPLGLARRARRRGPDAPAGRDRQAAGGQPPLAARRRSLKARPRSRSGPEATVAVGLRPDLAG